MVALAATATSLVIARGVPREENPGAFLHVLASAAANRAALRHPFDAHLGTKPKCCYIRILVPCMVGVLNALCCALQVRWPGPEEASTSPRSWSRPQ